MANKKASALPRGRIPVRMDSASIESQTIERVNRTMATIEDFLSRWDSAAKKPDGMLTQVARIKRFHEALSGWRRMALRAKGREAGRVQRLRDFVLICRIYS